MAAFDASIRSKPSSADSPQGLPGATAGIAASAAQNHALGAMQRWRWINLVYVVFLFFPPLFDPRLRGDPWVWAGCLAALLVFLPLYWQGYTAPQRRALWLATAVAALGLLLTPLSYSGNTFLIYALAAAGYGLPARRALLFAAGLLASYALLLAWLGLPWMLFMLVLVLGGVVLLGALVGRLEMLRNAELRLTQEEVRRLARINERERIGRDLHDLLGHTLSLVAIKSELAGKLIARDPEAAARQVGEIEAIARQALAEVRQAVTGMRSANLAAELAAARLNLLGAGIHFESLVPALPELPPAQEAALALALREAVTNVIRHAGASRVEVELTADRDQVLLHIRDDGAGGRILPGNGLNGMRERLEGLGGSLEIDAVPGQGSCLRIRLPLRGDRA